MELLKKRIHLLSPNKPALTHREQLLKTYSQAINVKNEALVFTGVSGFVSGFITGAILGDNLFPLPGHPSAEIYLKTSLEQFAVIFPITVAMSMLFLFAGDKIGSHLQEQLITKEHGRIFIRSA